MSKKNFASVDDFNKALPGCQIVLYVGGAQKLGGYLAMNLEKDATTPPLQKKHTLPADDGLVDVYSTPAAGGFYLMFKNTYALIATNSPDLKAVGNKEFAMAWSVSNLQYSNALFGKLYTVDGNGKKNYLHEKDTGLKVAAEGDYTGDDQWAISIVKPSDAMAKWMAANDITWSTPSPYPTQSYSPIQLNASLQNFKSVVMNNLLPSAYAPNESSANISFITLNDLQNVPKVDCSLCAHCVPTTSRVPISSIPPLRSPYVTPSYTYTPSPAPTSPPTRSIPQWVKFLLMNHEFMILIVSFMIVLLFVITLSLFRNL